MASFFSVYFCIHIFDCLIFKIHFIFLPPFIIPPLFLIHLFCSFISLCLNTVLSLYFQLWVLYFILYTLCLSILTFSFSTKVFSLFHWIFCVLFVDPVIFTVYFTTFLFI
uniref:Uncharacterized protein n=1 Tax=Anguilla anguilla TaxID=7936 RepID=A0A0E9XL64_ANGAN